MTLHIPITSFDNLHVLRGDMVDGGLKTPTLLKYLPKLNHDHFAYVGSVYGSGAWAVATACTALGLQCTLFIAKSDYIPSWLSYIKKADIHWIDPSPVTQIHQMVTTEYPSLYNLPLGFDTPDFINDMADVLKNNITDPPPEIWLPSVSGVISRAACIAFPDSQIHAVSTAKHHGNIGRAILHRAPEKYYKPAITPPPYPSCPFSDAKTWDFAQKMAISGAYILNVSS